VTDETACDTASNFQDAVDALEKAVSVDHVDLISVRIRKTESEELVQKQEDRVVALTNELVGWSAGDNNNGIPKFCVVLSSDWLHLFWRTKAHGIHFKESHREFIDDFRRQYYDQERHSPLVVGTSSHSIESAVDAWLKYGVDYLFVGTCYPTLSHPEKTSLEDLEGPALPGRVREALDRKAVSGDGFVTGGRRRKSRPAVFAIGGIDRGNCRELVVEYGADGVAVIRAVVHAQDPATEVALIRQQMTRRN